MKAFIAVFILFTTLFSAPALQKERTYTQADGSTFRATPRGDEYLHFLQTQSGDIVVYNTKTKNYDYAVVQDNTLIPSGKAYGVKRLKQAVGYVKEHTNPSAEQLQKVWQKNRARFGD